MDLDIVFILLPASVERIETNAIGKKCRRDYKRFTVKNYFRSYLGTLETFEIAKPCYLTITHVFCIKLYPEIISLSEISLRINLFYTRERQLLEVSLCKYQCWNFKAVICSVHLLVDVSSLTFYRFPFSFFFFFSIKSMFKLRIIISVINDELRMLV